MVESLFRMLCDCLAVAADASGPRIADQYANVVLYNQRGQRLKFCDDLVRGRAIVVNTMFTRCRGTCSGTMAVLQSLRKTLSPVFGKQLSFVSMTLEPEHDDVDVLQQYASLYDADEWSDALCDWHLVTGSAADIERLRYSLDFYDLNPAVDRDITQHDALLRFGNDVTDRWAVLPAGLREPLLVEAIRRIAGVGFEQRYGLKS